MLQMQPVTSGFSYELLWDVNIIKKEPNIYS